MTRTRLPRLLLAALLSLTASGCLSTTPPGVFLASTPPGARILIDGHDSGFVTPSSIDLSGQGRVRVDFELASYLPARIVLAPHGTTEGVSWTLGAPSPWAALHIPLALEARDLITPWRRNAGPHPQRVHVRLRPLVMDAEDGTDGEQIATPPATIELSDAGSSETPVSAGT